jgi:hypothetical protein
MRSRTVRPYAERLETRDCPSGLNVLAFLSSPEYVPPSIGKMYDDFLDRRTDPPGLAYYEAERAAGLPNRVIAAQIFDSAESQSKYADVPGELAGLYARALHRVPDPAGRDYWLLQAGGVVPPGLTDPPPADPTSSSPLVVIGYAQGTNIPVLAVAATVQPPSANPDQQWSISYNGLTWQDGDLQYRAFRSFIDATPGLTATYTQLN